MFFLATLAFGVHLETVNGVDAEPIPFEIEEIEIGEK